MSLAATFLALLAAGQAAPPPAEDWWYLSIGGGPGHAAALYADRASLQRDGDRVTMHQATRYEEVTGGNQSSRTTLAYDCRARTAQIVDAAFLGPDETVRELARGDPAPHPVGPGSVQEAGLNFACGTGEGLEQLRDLSLAEHARLLFRDYRAAHARSGRSK